jgi:hypothetical protein
MSATLQVPPLASGSLTAPGVPSVRRYVRSEAFDSALLVAPFATGMTAVLIVLREPRLFPLLLLADLWLLGYHHVVSTYTRLAFSPSTLRQNRFLAVDLLLLVTVVTLSVAYTAGAWVIASAFLYLQWFHYMRQGYGIGRMYYRATTDGQQGHARDWAADVVVYLVPTYAIAHRSLSIGDTFLGMPVKAVAVPPDVVAVLGVAASIAVAVWAFRTARAAITGRSDAPYTAFLVSHVAIFLVGYVLVDDADTGWLAINIWHNVQYVMVVWMANAKRYAGGIDHEARLISRLSQPDRVVAYVGTCLLVSTAVYLGLSGVTTFMLGGGLALTTGVYMGINFHHYIVDALIWKRRRPVSQAA